MAKLAPDVLFEHVPIAVEKPQGGDFERGFKRHQHDLNVSFAGGRCHVLIGKWDEGRWTTEILDLVSGRARPRAGRVRVGGRSPWCAAVSALDPHGRDRLRRWQVWEPRSPLARTLKALERGTLCVLYAPTNGLSLRLDDPAREISVVRDAIRAAIGRGATVIADFSGWTADAAGIGDEFHVGDRFGSPPSRLRHGDFETIYRPTLDDRIAPDAQITHMPGARAMDFDGVQIPLWPSGYMQSRTGLTFAFSAWHWEAAIHVPTRYVVVEPAFRHGEPSGSPDLSSPSDHLRPGVPRDLPFGQDLPPVSVDLTARYIVLEGEVVGSYPAGPWTRLRVRTKHGLSFKADLPGTAEVPRTVRIGFDTAHIRHASPDYDRL
jgi:hypothetical protein